MDDPAIPYALQNMTAADVPAVAALERIAFSLPWSPQAFEHEVRHNPMAHFLVLKARAATLQGQQAQSRSLLARIRGRPSPNPLIGYGGMWLIVDEGHICTLAVHPEWRGRGLGELLLTGLVERATALGAAVATLEVRASNLIAQNLYQKYGFAKMGVRKGYYSDTHEDALVMTTDLLSSAAYQQRFQGLRTALLHRLAGQLDDSAEKL